MGNKREHKTQIKKLEAKPRADDDLAHQSDRPASQYRQVSQDPSQLIVLDPRADLNSPDSGRINHPSIETVALSVNGSMHGPDHSGHGVHELSGPSTPRGDRSAPDGRDDGPTRRRLRSEKILGK